MKKESNKNWTTCLRLNTGDGSPRVFLLNSHFLGSVPKLRQFFLFVPKEMEEYFEKFVNLHGDGLCFEESYVIMKAYY